MIAHHGARDRVRVAVLGALAAVVLASCAVPTGHRSGREPIEARTDSVVIGAFNFSESRILAEIYRQALEAAGIPAEIADHVASREIMEPALEQGEVDLVPEYLGTALTFLAGPHDLTTSRRAWRHLRDAFDARAITSFAPAPGQNRNEIVVTRELARRYSLKKISDLEPIAGDLVFGGPPECPPRPHCLAGLESVYGLDFARFLPLDSGGPATVAALRGREVDVALLFTTSPALNDPGLKLLRDDRKLQPPENIVTVARNVVVERYGARFKEVIDAVSGGLTDHSLRVLNQKAEVHGQPIPEIAAEWLRARGLS